MARLDHQRARQVFEACLELPAELRGAFVQAQAGDDAALLAHVRQLLAADGTATDFLEKPASLAGALPAAEAYVGRRVGRYTLTRLLGWGGMGRVYEATQDHPRRTVALKIIGSLPTPEALRRFRYECEVLGRLQHPGIAPMHEAFAHPDPLTGEQLPCFAMELIPGARPITSFAQERGLGVEDRLRLMIEACEAVHHAHQRGVIHRDLKPGNVLVGADGRVKVIDFGIARVEDASHATAGMTRATYTGQMMGTLSYMSPEQASGDARDVDLRSDVYSLGVVLYELVSGKLPYNVETASALEAARIIRETPPTRMRATMVGVSGDLEAIAFKALAKRADERYQSAAELAADMGRFLRGEPIVARPPTVWRQIRHVWRRHRTLGTAAVLVLGSLVVAVIGTGTGLMRVTVARNDVLTAQLQSDQRARSATQTAEFLISVLAAGNPLQPRGFAPLMQPESMLATVAEGSPAGTLGRGPSANELLQFAAQRVRTAMPTDPLARARVQASLGQILVNCGLVMEAGLVLEEAYTTLRERLGPMNLETARAAEWRAHQIAQFVVTDRAVELRREALEARRVTQGENHPEFIRATMGLAWAMAWNAERDEKAAAVEVQRTNAEHAAALNGDDSLLGLEQRGALAFILNAAGRHDEAASVAMATLDGLARSGQSGSATAGYTHSQLAGALRLMDRAREAEGHARAALALAVTHLGGEDAAGLESFRMELAWCLIGQRRWQEAAAVVERQLATTRLISGPEHHASLKLEGRLGFLLLRSGDRLEQAEALLRHASAGTRALPEVWRAQWYEAYLAEVARRRGRAGEAIERLDALLAERSAGAPGGVVPVDLLDAQMTLIRGRSLVDLGRNEEGQRLLEKALADLEATGADPRRSLVFDAGDARASLESLTGSRPGSG